MQVNEQLRQDIMAGPDFFPHKIDPLAQTILFLRLSREQFAKASFLDDRVITATTQGQWVGLRDLDAALADINPMAPVHFIFHAGHVGSTLLSRLIEGAGNVLALREPLSLRNMAEIQDDTGAAHALFSEAHLNRLLQMNLVMWSRRYADTRAVSVKATSATARLGPRILSLHPATRAISIYLDAEPYLATLLSGANSAIDLRGMARERVIRLRWLTRTELPKPLHAMSLGEIAAMTWSVETITRAAMQQGASGRVLQLDFESLLAHPGERLKAVFDHLGLAAPPGYFENAAQNPLFSSYSKATEAPYSPALRAEILNEARRQHQGEISKGLAWIEGLRTRAPSVARMLGPSAA